jgi:hypothetical protein
LEGTARLELGQAIRFDISVASTAELRRYLDENLFLFGGLASTGVPGQADLAVTLLGGAGWGRFRDVTPLAKAVKVSEALQQEKIISHRSRKINSIRSLRSSGGAPSWA